MKYRSIVVINIILFTIFCFLTARADVPFAAEEDRDLPVIVHDIDEESQYMQVDQAVFEIMTNSSKRSVIVEIFRQSNFELFKEDFMHLFEKYQLTSVRQIVKLETSDASFREVLNSWSTEDKYKLQMLFDEYSCKPGWSEYCVYGLPGISELSEAEAIAIAQNKAKSDYNLLIGAAELKIYSNDYNTYDPDNPKWQIEFFWVSSSHSHNFFYGIDIHARTKEILDIMPPY